MKANKFQIRLFSDISDPVWHPEKAILHTLVSSSIDWSGAATLAQDPTISLAGSGIGHVYNIPIYPAYKLPKPYLLPASGPVKPGCIPIGPVLYDTPRDIYQTPQTQKPPIGSH